MTHTPTPLWSHTGTKDWATVYVVDGPNTIEHIAGIMTKENKKEVAARIVHCVNTHDALVEALEYLLDLNNVALTHAKWGDGCNREEVDGMVKQARKALTLAKEGV